MSFLETKTIWIVQNSQIFRLESGRIENWNLKKNFFATNKFGSLGNSCGKFEVKSFLQGYIFLIDQSLWFLPDSDRRNWLVLANLVDSFETFEESLFWQSGQNLYNYNSITGLEKYLGQIELNTQKQNTVMFYDFNWRRLMIYATGKNTDKNNFSINLDNSQNLKNPQSTQKITNSDSTNLNQVWSVWFDKSNPSSQNIIFYPKIWLENKNCLNKIQDQLQFCLQDENLITYGNFDFF